MGLQRVDGRRIDALVADMLCSRLHSVAAPAVSYVSAPLVRRAFMRVCICASVCAVRMPVCGGGFVCVCRYPITVIFEGIDFELMEKSFFIFKVTSNID